MPFMHAFIYKAWNDYDESNLLFWKIEKIAEKPANRSMLKYNLIGIVF